MNSHETHESAPVAPSAPTRLRTFGGVAAAGWIALVAVLSVLIAVTAAALVGGDQQNVYEAEALVVASELEIRVDSFPGTAAAIFEGGPVAELTAAIAGTGIDPDDLIPEIITISPIENTGVVAINAVHRDPELAQAYANAAADALVEELNGIGPGLGVFVVHSPARIPDTPVSSSFPQRVLVGVLAAVVFLVGIVALLAVTSAWRRRQQQLAAPEPIRMDMTSTVVGIGPVFEERLNGLGIHSLSDLTVADPEWLANVMEITPERVVNWIEQAESLLSDPAAPPSHPMSDADDVRGR